MSITINLPPATLDWLHAQSQASGKNVETLVAEAVESKLAFSKLSFADAIRPLQDAVAASGLRAEEAEKIFEEELATSRRERRLGRS